MKQYSKFQTVPMGDNWLYIVLQVHLSSGNMNNSLCSLQVVYKVAEYGDVG